MIAVSISCYLIKYPGKQKHLVQFHITNNKLKELIFNNIYKKMSNKVKDISINNHTYVIKIKNFDPNNINVDQKSYKKFLFPKLDLGWSKTWNM